MVGRRTGIAAFALEFGGGAAVNQYPTAAYTAMGVGAVLLAWVFVDWLRSYAKEQHNALLTQLVSATRRNLIPIMIGAAVLASIILLAVAVGLSLMYRAGSFESKAPDIVINAPPPTPVPASPPTYGKLVANDPPDIPEEVAKRVARYLQLEDAIERAKAVRPALEANGIIYRDRMKPFKVGEGRPGGIGFVDRWNYPLKELTAINGLIYKNRTLDITSVPQLAIPTMVAPDESAFPEDAGEARYRYRAFHFLLQNILKQADQLISDMEKEASLVRKTIDSILIEKLDH
jgi:hypothetical protein